jgi:hypothetical protein
MGVTGIPKSGVRKGWDLFGLVRGGLGEGKWNLEVLWMRQSAAGQLRD